MTLELDKSYVSYSEVKGDWDKRKISIFGVAKSILSQLSSGQDLTNIGLPSVFLQPFSLLELAAARKLGHFNHLLSFNEKETDVERMMLVLRWFLSYISEEQPNKKPYNPVIGETHTCKVVHKEGGGETRFFAEQVSHHPPVTAFLMKNKEKKVKVEGNFTFAVKFETNTVITTTDGFIEVKSTDPNREDEVYRINKGLPDLLINNVIFGTRTMGWTGDVIVTCEKTNLSTLLNFKKHKNRVNLDGNMYRDDEKLYEFEGLFMEDPIYCNPTVDYLPQTVLFDVETINKCEIIYPTPLEVGELNSFKVWGTVTESIVNNDMKIADIEKKRIEAEQRKRIKDWDNTDFMYFALNEIDRWVFCKRKQIDHNAS
jgi:hypothetical protein